MIKETKTPKIKILVGYHKPAVLLKDDILTPIHLGRALATQASKDGEMSKEDFKWMCENMIGDDTGDNISHLNRYFCELTGIYWAWKNYDKLGNPDYIGFMHYRRHFIFDGEYNYDDKLLNYHPITKQIDYAYKDAINTKHLIKIEDIDLIIPKYFDTNYANCKTVKDFFTTLDQKIECLKIIENNTNQNLLKRYKYFPCNMFIMKKNIFFEYCVFLFKIIFQCYKLLSNDLAKRSIIQQREIGYASEHLTSLFIENQIKCNKKIKKYEIGFVENTNDIHIKNHYYKQILLHKSHECNFVSFDLFDTLLLRPYVNPTDVFLHIETQYNISNFCFERKQAEIKATKTFNRQVTFDEIYQFMPDNISFAKNIEKQLEFQTIYVNPEMLKIFEKIKSKNKKIIIISDMYYSKKYIECILNKNNLFGYYKLYISSEYSKSKHHGDLYQHIIDDLKIDANNIIHIGDNYYADYQQAINNGLKALHYEAPIMQFFNAFPRLKKFYDENNNLTSHIIIGLLLKKWVQSNKNIENYWEYFGYFYGGPICYGLSKFVYDEAVKENLKEFIFVARDGYTIEKIFNLLQKQYNTNIKTAYVYANRLILTSIFFKDIIKQEEYKITNYITQIGLNIEKIKDINFNDMTFEELKEVFKQNYNEFKHISDKISFLYKNYIKNFNFKEKKIGLFDIVAYSGTSYKILNKVLNNRHIIAHYLKIMPEFYNNKNVKSYEKKCIEYRFDDLLEFIITAPEMPIKTITENLNFIYQDNIFEKKRVDIYKFISAQEINFSKDMIKTFDQFAINFSPNTLMNQIKLFAENADNDDMYFFKDIYHSRTGIEKDYIKIQLYNSQNHSIKNYNAVNIVKNHLSYKIGQEIIQMSNIKNIFLLPFKLIKIYQEYLFDKKIEKIMYDLDPNLKPLPLNHYSDYQEALKIQNYLSYKLGNLLIKHPFTFVFRVAKVYKEWKKEINE